MAAEEPAFTLVLHEGDFEVRDYPALVVAEVTVTGDQKESASKGFRLLAHYIFGGNTKQQSIAMTAPVAQQRVSERNAMTAPVTQIPHAGSWVVRFHLPHGYSLATLPKPDDPSVQLKNLPPRRVAVVRFSGWADQKEFDAKTAALSDFVKSHGLRANGPASLSQYNPPWTLWFARRNEVMIPLEP
ncbi:MAG: heme-binding protein [Rhizomicrobium sp.]|nr:heme-binding protein [Rhizomicrobium sp.]